MAYHRSGRNGLRRYGRRALSGLFDPITSVAASAGVPGMNCGADQVFDPNLVYNGIKGQCVPKGATMTAPPKAGFLETILKGAMFSATPVAPAVIYAPAPGAMSTTTKIALAGGAVLLIALLVRD